MGSHLILRAVGFVGGLCGLAIFAISAPPPNVIVFVADDLGWDDSGPYGNPSVKTPTMDRLAADGLVFDRALLTTSSCSPSRCSILTGRYPHNTGAPELHQPLPADQVLVSTFLRHAGYYTAAVGKWHLGEAAKVQFDRVWEKSGPSGAENWVEALQDRPRDRPFFFWLASYDPHRGYEPNTIPQPHRPAAVIVPPYLPDTPEVRADLALYYDEISRFDHYVGLACAELEAQGVLDNTFIIVISDNGRPFPRAKTRLLDSGIRTPFIVCWPAGLRRVGARTSQLVSVIDIAPTLVDLAGLAPESSFQGTSFAATLHDASAHVRDYAFAEHNWHDYQARERSVSDSRYTYIRNSRPDLPATPPADAVGSPTFRAMQRLERAGELSPAMRDAFIAPRATEELYDNLADPHSLHDLIADPAHAAALHRVRAALDQWIRDTDDQFYDDITPDHWHREHGTRLNPGRRPAGY
ncbi:sulfatase family protein [Synoicihabitans lomoniglobus]|uniref:Sulfatase n=1 Tax=Synoicihabitans lomoniglobus TaxID=2909285 RepID=A0AAF0CT31_9BACT|nr:sulfatase [Opitutaceae bacterium LMO-M01]WED67518.1 sulfatase [Opitutaceae bacterium LMO-M01]